MDDEIQLSWDQYDSMIRECQPDEKPTDEYSHYLCKFCGGLKVFDHAELPVCGTCGIMDFEFLSEEAEWGSGIDNDGTVTDGSRCGAPSSDFFSSSWNIGSKISTHGYSTYAEKKMARIHFHGSMNHKDRSLFHAYAEIERIASKLNCSTVIIDAAKYLYKDFNSKKLTRGDVRAGIKANCIFLACKQNNVPRTTKEIADACGIDTKYMGRTAQILEETVHSGGQTITMPKDIIPRILSALNVQDGKFKCKCVKLCSTIERHKNLMGKTPSGIAAAIVYIMLEDHKTEICKAASISVATLNKMERTIREIISEFK